MEPSSDRGSSPVLPRVWTRGVRTSPLVPHVSRRCCRVSGPISGRVDSAIPLPVPSLSRASSSPRRRRCFGELARACLLVSGQATASSAPQASPLHRRQVGCDCRASVSPHCLLRRELASPEFRHGHRRRGQGSVAHHSFSFLFQKLR